MRVKYINKTTVEIKLYGNIGGWFANGETISDVLDSLEKEGVIDVTFRMHCYGGSVIEGDVIGGAIARSTMDIKIIIDGVSASMACMVLPYLPKEKISIAENGWGMIHCPRKTTQGTAKQHLEAAHMLLKIEGNFVKTLAKRTGKAADEIKSEYLDSADHWLTADEMIAIGLVGSKVEAIADVAKLDKQRVSEMNEEEMYALFTAWATEEKSQFKDDNMKKELIEALNLQGLSAESSDTAVIAAVQSKLNEQSKRLEALEKSQKEAQASAIKAELDRAKVPAKKRATYEAIAQSNGIEALRTILETAAPAGVQTPLVEQIVAQGKVGAADASEDWNWYQANAVKELEKMQVENPDQFIALYTAEYGYAPTI
ncbi:MAG: ATP-dependent Clp protease proteolytic subunit [Bacteroidales bacterium]